MCRMFRSSSEALPSWIRLARFNWSSFTVICFIYQYPDTCRSNLTPGLDRLFKAYARVIPRSRPRLKLMFPHVCVCRQIVASTFAPSWSGIGQVARLTFSGIFGVCWIAGRWRGSSACQRPGDLPALRVVCRYSPVGFDRQQRGWNEYGTFYAISSDFGDRMTTQL